MLLLDKFQEKKNNGVFRFENTELEEFHVEFVKDLLEQIPEKIPKGVSIKYVTERELFLLKKS